MPSTYSNNVFVQNWYSQPIHCPFCGKALESQSDVACKHLLFIISAGNFVARSKRCDSLIGNGSEDGVVWPEFSVHDKQKFGLPTEVSIKVLEKSPSSMQYCLEGPTDTTFVGFAPLEEELCQWGKTHESPYKK